MPTDSPSERVFSLNIATRRPKAQTRDFRAMANRGMAIRHIAL